MKKSLLLAVCLAGVFTFTENAQAFELSAPSLNNLKSITTPAAAPQKSDVKFDPSGTIGQINTKLYNIDSTVQNAYISLFSALLSKEDFNKYKAELDAIKTNKNLSETEKRAKLAQVATDTSAILAKEEKQAEISQNLKELSEAKRTEYINALTNLTSASMQYMELAAECKSLATSISTNPAMAVSLAFELKQVKDTAALLKSNLKSIKNVTTQVIAINKANGIDVKLPETQAGKTKKIDIQL